jgi:hypothetical protein
LRDEKAPLFGLWRACWDNNPAFWRICRDCQAKRDRRPPAAISAPLKTNEQSSKKTAKDCDDEWRADQEAMMKRGMTEESYVEQCSVEDDVPAIPTETKTNAAPSAAPK